MSNNADRPEDDYDDNEDEDDEDFQGEVIDCAKQSIPITFLDISLFSLLFI